MRLISQFVARATSEAIWPMVMLKEAKLKMPPSISDSKIAINALTRSSIKRIDRAADSFEYHKLPSSIAFKAIELIISSFLILALPPFTVPNLRPIAFLPVALM